METHNCSPILIFPTMSCSTQGQKDLLSLSGPGHRYPWLAQCRVRAIGHIKQTDPSQGILSLGNQQRTATNSNGVCLAHRIAQSVWYIHVFTYNSVVDCRYDPWAAARGCCKAGSLEHQRQAAVSLPVTECVYQTFDNANRHQIASRY